MTKMENIGAYTVMKYIKFHYKPTRRGGKYIYGITNKEWKNS